MTGGEEATCIVCVCDGMRAGFVEGWMIGIYEASGSGTLGMVEEEEEEDKSDEGAGCWGTATDFDMGVCVATTVLNEFQTSVMFGRRAGSESIIRHSSAKIG